MTVFLKRGMVLLSLVLLAAPTWADETQEGLSLEYRPDRPELVPEEKKPPPQLSMFAETIGEFGISDGSFDGPVDAAVNTDGEVYVVDAGNDRIQKFDSGGDFVLAWGSSGSGDGEFDDPRAVALDQAGNVYVVDSGNHRIQKFDPVGEFLQAWGSLGSREGDFDRPVDMTFDDEGTIWVLDAGNERVQHFNAAGRFLEEWGRFEGGRGGTFSDQVSIAWADDDFGYIYLLGAEGCHVQQFDTDGDLEAEWDAAGSGEDACEPARLEIDNNDDFVYVLDAGTSVLLRYTKEGQFQAELTGGEMPFTHPRGFAVDIERDDVYVADTGSHVLQKFTLR